MKIKRIAVFICVLFLLLNSVNVLAQEKESFERITDSFFDDELTENNIIGAAVSVIKDGKVLFEKGYGYSDLNNKRPVDAKITGFQIASVSKLFTATAVMQLAEEGKLSLNEDINNYLTAFKIENPFDTPVTLRTLLTHTSGIDDRMPLYLPTNGEKYFEDMPSLENVLKENIAPVVKKPGTVCQYNVFGMALAGYIVEMVSGIPLDEYITENIMKPLDMNHSSYGLTKDIFLKMSKPYKYNGKKYERGTYTLINDHPSGSICSTASDMGKFIMAHLNNTLLSADTEKLMQTHQVPDDERLTGYSLGFYEAMRNGCKTLEHGGYLPSFASKLSILPEQKIGVFIVINTKSKTSNSIINKYIDSFYKYFTENKVTVPKNRKFDMNAKAISGQYSGSHGTTDFTKIKSVLDTTTINCDDNGNLTYIGEGEKWRFYYIGDGVFFCNDNANYLRIKEQNGKQVLSVLGNDYIKVPFLDMMLFKITIICIPLLLLSIIIALILLIRKRKGILPLLQSVFILVYLCLNISIPLYYATGNTAPVLNIVKPLIPIVCFANFIIFILMICHTVKLWIKYENKFVYKVWHTLVCMIALLTILFMMFMNGFVV